MTEAVEDEEPLLVPFEGVVEVCNDVEDVEGDP